MAIKNFGVDISLYQGDFDFSAARSEGVKYAIIKSSEGNFADPKFERNYAAAKAAGMPVGAYHYLRSTDDAGAASEAEGALRRCLAGKVFEYPIFVDVEDPALAGLSKERLSQIVKTFCNTLERLGYWAGFYTNLDWYRNRLNGAELAKRYSFWLAFWGEKCALSDCQMWQFGGETNCLRSNRVAGVVCDQDYCFVDYPSKIAAKGLNGMKKAAQAAPSVEVISVGDTVKLLPDAVVYGTNKKFAPFVYSSEFKVREISGSRVVFAPSMSGAVTGAVDRKYLKKA